MDDIGQSPNLSISLGTFKTAPLRRMAYIKAAQRTGFPSLGAWVKAVCDKAAGYTDKGLDRFGKAK